MPPPLALLACVIFVFVLLRREAKESSVGVTKYLWVPTLWFLILATRSLAMWFGTGGATIEEGSIVDELVNLVLLAFALVTLATRRFVWANALRQNRWLILLLAFMLASILWSDIAFVSFRRWVTYVIAIIMIFSVQTEPLPCVAAEHILLRIVYICIPFSYLTIHYYPEYGKTYVHTQGLEMWIGVTIHKNGLAELCLISFLLITWKIATKEKNSVSNGKLGAFLDWVILLITILVFMGPNRSITYSATTLASTIVGLGTLGFLRWHKRRRTQPALVLLIAVSVCLIVYGTVTPFLGKLSLVDVSGMLGRQSSLTGRTEVWASLMPAVSDSPFLGYGVGGFWTTQAREFYDISGTHNGYLGEILEGGFAGFLILFVYLLSITKAAHRLLSVDTRWGALCLMFLFAILSHNIAEETINSFTSRLFSVLILLNVSCYASAPAVAYNSASRSPLAPQ